MRLTFTFISILFVFSLSAQYEKGTWYLDANSQAEVTNFNFGLGDLLQSSVTGGFFLERNLLVGARLEAGSFLGDGLNTANYRIIPFVRYYLPAPKARKLRWYAETGFGLQFENNLQLNAHLGVGAEYKIAPGVYATAGLRYTAEPEQRPGGLTFNLGLNVRLGEVDEQDDALLAGQKGDFLLAGTFGSISAISLGDIDVFSAGLSVNGAYFLSDNLILEGGADVFATSVNYNGQNNRGSELYGYSVTAGLSYLFNRFKRFRPYVAAGLRYGSYEQEYRYVLNGEPSTFLFKEQGASAYGRAGFLYMLNRQLALDVNVSTRLRLTGDGPERRFGGGVGLKVFLGKQ